MSRFIATLKIIRFQNCLLALVGVLIGAYMTGGSPAYFAPFMSSIAVFFACASGNIINDLLDIEADKVNHPDRVLVREQVSRQYAMFLAILFNLLAIGFALLTSAEVIILVFVAILLLLLYNFFLKKIILLGNFIIGILGAMTFLTGGVAVDFEMSFILPGPLIPAVYSFMFHLIREMIKDVEDIEGDSQVMVQTIPQIIGIRLTMIVSLLLFAGLVVLTIIPVITGWFGNVYKIITIYFIDLPLLMILIFVSLKPNRQRLHLGSQSLKFGMALGIIALLAA